MADFNLFGFKFTKTPKEKKEEKLNQSFVTPTNEDGAVTVEGGLRGTLIDIDGSIKGEATLITRYREMSLYPELDMAIDQITNECIIIEDDIPPVKVNFTNNSKEKLPQKIQDKIEEEFEFVLKLLDFNNQGYELFRKWYIDGRLFYHTVLTEGKEKEGIKELRYIDPRQIRKIRVADKEIDKNTNLELVKIIDEFYAYNSRGLQYPFSDGAASGGLISASQAGSVSGVKISKDVIVHVHSGITDRFSSMILGHLHKSMRPLNQLKMMEDASVIYRIVRAPERRIFYIDVQDLPKTKADQYIRDMMTQYRSKMVYDPSSGQIQDDRKFTTMMEDFWLPRRNGVATTSIDTLPGGENLGEIRDIEYFQRKLYKALNVPVGRLDPNNAFNIGRAAEITRDEVSFSKFITRLRLRFSHLFDAILEKQLILKDIIKQEDWPEIKQNIHYAWAKDNFFAELKEQEILKERMNTLVTLDPYANKYYSVKWIRENVLKQTEEDMKEIDKQIKSEKDKYIDISQDSSGPEKEPSTVGFGGNEIKGGKDKGGSDVGSIKKSK